MVLSIGKARGHRVDDAAFLCPATRPIFGHCDVSLLIIKETDLYVDKALFGLLSFLFAVVILRGHEA